MKSPIELERLLQSIFPKASLPDRNRIAMKTSILMVEIPDAPVIPLLKRTAAAYVRHTKTPYEEYLLFLSREECRAIVNPLVISVLTLWSGRNI